MCDKLVVGVTIDELVQYKGKNAMIPFEDRIEIVRSCKYVDAAVPQYDMDKLTACKKLGATVLFVGDDWYGTEKWKKYEEAFAKEGIKIIYFPYTQGISSTKINTALKHVRGWSKRRVDLNYCMSSFLVFRYIINDDVDFFEKTHHTIKPLIPDSRRVLVKNAEDIDKELQKQFNILKGKKLGLLLSGGMDSACLASYMRGQEAYTFRFESYQNSDLHRAEKYAQRYGLKLHYVDISWGTVKNYVDIAMQHKGAPVHSIEPQIIQAALQARNDGVEMMIIGDAADYVFGGMDGLHAKDWTYEEFKERFIYIHPEDVLKEPVDMDFAFEKYRHGEEIDFIALMHEYTDIESYASYDNAFESVGVKYLDPYEILKMSNPLDLNRIRNGDSKYLIRDLFRMKYPSIPVPEKIPMPRPVDEYFKDWKGPTRPEFRNDIDITKYSGNQRWLLWCLERFLNTYDNSISIKDKS